METAQTRAPNFEEQRVLHNQNVRFGAMISGNKSTLDSVLIGELSYTHPTGKNETKAEPHSKAVAG